MAKRQYYKGKRISKGEKRIAEYLDFRNIKYSREYTFNDCLSERGNCLRFDFYLPNYNLCIEFQGQHHTGPVNKYRRAKIVHNITVKHDEIKRIYTKQKNIKLIEIDLKDYENIENILNLLLE
jgi:hypothetical protein